MDFFKSVFADDPEPSNPQNLPIAPPKSQSDNQDLQPLQPNPNPNPNPNANPSISAITNAWSFGGLIKTLASKSDSVIETCRRDLEEFGSGLRKETSVIRDVAGRAMRDLPASLEAGAAAAQESLESVGQAIDHIGITVTEIISQGKDSILEPDSDNEISYSRQIGNNSSRPYSRIDAQIRAIQCDLNTYCKEPEDSVEYNEWKLEFNLGEKGGEIGDLIDENGSVEEIYNEVVPGIVDEETFWCRYFYRAYKVKQAEEARAKLVKRAISGEEEEVLSWDVDDDDYEDGNGGSKSKERVEDEGSSKMGIDDYEDSGGSNPKERVEDEGSSKMGIDGYEVESEEKSLRSENDESKGENVVNEIVHFDGLESSGNKFEEKTDEKLGSEGKPENGGSCRDSEFSVVSSQPSMPEEEDLGWDEIEDIGSTDEIKATSSGSPSRSDLKKRLSAMEVEEDLSWDIEDDDEPVKS